jgi:hypothetical protein
MLHDTSTRIISRLTILVTNTFRTIEPILLRRRSIVVNVGCSGVVLAPVGIDPVEFCRATCCLVVEYVGGYGRDAGGENAAAVGIGAGDVGVAIFDAVIVAVVGSVEFVSAWTCPAASAHAVVVVIVILEGCGTAVPEGIGVFETKVGTEAISV